MIFLLDSTTCLQITSRVLCQTIEPEEKRKIIGDTFMNVVDDEAKSLDLTINDCFLAQGKQSSASGLLKVWLDYFLFFCVFNKCFESYSLLFFIAVSAVSTLICNLKFDYRKVLWREAEFKISLKTVSELQQAAEFNFWIVVSFINSVSGSNILAEYGQACWIWLSFLNNVKLDEYG